jgi:hypothetical protein
LQAPAILAISGEDGLRDWVETTEFYRATFTSGELGYLRCTARRPAATAVAAPDHATPGR